MAPRLKSLELHGYKTFASRTLFEFPGRITAIVGPNGSGKSNIADALRWVLGEQSYTLLRGRKTEDMIFSGSEHRPRAGMASATVTFDNEDGWLPIDFNEVSIGRRAYRDGQNEYIINSQRVRLKEISELLGQSGLSERTYTIIGQGLVDAALSLKPDERRRFFEEAAGIGLYRARREEAVNRLETTRRNLERVRDILGELAPRLRSLERQAQRAIEYERIKADLQVLMREWYGYQWHRLQNELAHSKQVVAAQEEQLGLARHRMAEVEAEVSSLRSEVQALRSQLNEWHNQIAALHLKREKVSRELAVLDERQRATQESEQNLTSDLARLEEEEKARTERLAELRAEHQRQQSELEEAKAQLAQARLNLQNRQKERVEIEARLKSLRRELTDGETRQVQRKARLQEIQSRIETLCRSQETLQKSVDGAAAALEQANKAFQKAREQRTEAEVERNELEEQLQALSQQAVALENRRRQAQEKLTRLTADESRLRAQLDVLEQAEATLSGLNQGAKAVLEGLRKGKLTGNLQALSAVLEVPAEYEVAIAAALGENLDALLLDGGGDPEAVIDYLQNDAKGRATIYPAAWLLPTNPLKAPSDADAIGMAIDLIRVPAELQVFVRVLLGQVLVVRNRQSARRLLRQLPPTARAVTLQGEVFTGNGAVTAGTDGRTTVIARPRQKRELQEALDEVQDRIAEIDDELDAVERDRDRQQSERAALEKRYKEANQRLNQLTQQYQQASLAVEQVRQKEEFQRRQLVEVEKEIQTARKNHEDLERELDSLSARLKELSDQVRATTRELNEHPLEELQTQVVHWNTNLAVAERAVKDASRRVEEHEALLADNQRRQQSLRQRFSAQEKLLAEIEEAKVALRQQESELNEQTEALQRLIDPSEKSLADREGELESIQNNYMTAQQAVTAAERRVTQAHLELGRNRDSLDSLRRRIEEDFGLVAFEYNNDVAGPTPLPLDGMVEELPRVTTISPEVEESINRQRAQLRRLGAINPEAHSEYLSVKERYDFLTGQVADLIKADEDLREVIAELDDLMKREFRRTFDAVSVEFKQMFTRLFGGGTARLEMTDEDNPTETGIDIEARLPGRRTQGLSLLSGGERSLTAVALIFALLKVSPTPFCVLDEVDAMLDEANVGRFTELLRELAETTQFIVVTHNRNTVQVADVIYGVTMGKDSASQVISLRLDEVGEEMVR